MGSRFKTPSPNNEPIASSSTNIYFGAARDSTVTLVGDLSPPHSSKAVSPPSILSQRASSRETPDPVSRSPVTPRKKPVCKTCGTPRKGHKRGTCTPSAPPDECKSLHASSPDRKRTPTKASVLAERRAVPLQSTSAISSVSSIITSISASGKRRPIHGACGLPMKGHKRQNGVLICPSEHAQDASLTSLRIKGQKSMDQKPGFLNSPSDRQPKDHFAHHTDSVNHTHEQNANPTSISANTSSRAQIKPVVHVDSMCGRSRSGSPNPFASSDSLYSSVSTFVSSITTDSQSTAVMPSFSALNDALGEPALIIYPAWNREEVFQVRQRAGALRFFSGVVNVKIEEEDGLDITHAIRKGNADDHDVPSSHYMKWVIVSGQKEMVKKCVHLCEERPLEL